MFRPSPPARSTRPALLAALALLALGAAPDAARAQTTYVGQDPGANNRLAIPNSDAAAALFDAAVPGASVLTFETGTATQSNVGNVFTVDTNGATFTLTNQSTNFPPLNSTLQISFNGFNTTAGGNVRLFSSGANFSALRTVTVAFDAPVDAFGAYITGVGNTNGFLTLTYNDGTPRSFDLTTLVGSNTGGGGFFGVSGGGSFSALAFTLALENSETRDAFSFDDFRFRAAPAPPPGGGVIPEPGTLALAATGLLPLVGAVVRRRRKAA